MLPAYVSCWGFIGKEVLNTKTKRKEGKLPAFRFSFMCLGLTEVIEVQHLQHKITAVQTVSRTSYKSSNSGDIKFSRRMFHNSK